MRHPILFLIVVGLTANSLSNSANAQFVDADDATSIITPVMLHEVPYLLGESAWYARMASSAEAYAARCYPAYQQQCFGAARCYQISADFAEYAIEAYRSADPAKADYVDRLMLCDTYSRLSLQWAQGAYQMGYFSRSPGRLAIARSEECIELLVRVWPML